jgi:putative transcriptional regulator
MEENSSRKCRICLEIQEENDLRQGNDLISPCNCRGTQKYVHKICLAEWQRVAILQPNPRRAYECSVCKTAFSFQPKEKFQKKILRLLLPPVWARQFLVASFGILFIFNSRQLPFLLQYLAAFTAIYFSFRLRIGMADGDPVLAVMPGSYLVADRIPRGSIFFQSVVLILQHDSNVGSLGVIVNNARDIGGPVASWESVILTDNGSPELSVVEGVEGLFWRRGIINSVEDEAGRGGIDARVKVLRGICGWAPRQLDGEVRRGSWKVVRADADSALTRHTDPTLWQTLNQTGESFL